MGLWSLIVILAIGQPSTVASAPQVGVAIEVTIDGQLALPGEAPRIAPGAMAIVEVTVWGPDAGGVDPSTLLEVIEPSGSRFRIDDWERSGSGELRTGLRLQSSGEWVLRALPEVGERGSLSPGTTDSVKVVVETPPATRSLDPTTLAPAALLVAAVAALVTTATRGRPRHKRPPVVTGPDDIWWGGP